MRRILQAVLLVMAFVAAVPVSAQQPAPVGIPGTAAVEAGMTNPKSVDPVPPTLAVFKKVDFTPAAGTRAQGTNSKGWYVGAHAGFGSGSWLDVVDTMCSDVGDVLDVECGGEDRGPVFTLGVDTRYALNRLFDVGVRAEFAKPDDVELNASSTFEGQTLSITSTAKSTMWSVSGQFGVSPTPRLRFYGGWGWEWFDLDVASTLTAFGETETHSDSSSGDGPRFYGGGEYFLHRRFSLFVEGSRSWLKDESEELGVLEDFEEKYSRWVVGVRAELLRPRW